MPIKDWLKVTALVIVMHWWLFDVGYSAFFTDEPVHRAFRGFSFFFAGVVFLVLDAFIFWWVFWGRKREITKRQDG